MHVSVLITTDYCCPDGLLVFRAITAHFFLRHLVTSINEQSFHVCFRVIALVDGIMPSEQYGRIHTTCCGPISLAK